MRIRGTVASRRPGPRKQRRTGTHWLLLFALLLSAAFIEVWESTTASQLSIEIDRLQEEVQTQEARLAHMQTRTAEVTSRVALDRIAKDLGLRPADPEQIVMIPTEYLEFASEKRLPGDGVVAVGQRLSDVFVPSARARDRGPEEGGS